MDAQERVLNDVASVLLVPDERERDGEGAPLMTLDQLPEGSLVTFLCAPNELKIHLRLALARGLEGTRPRCGTYV